MLRRVTPDSPERRSAQTWRQPDEPRDARRHHPVRDRGSSAIASPPPWRRCRTLLRARRRGPGAGESRARQRHRSHTDRAALALLPASASRRGLEFSRFVRRNRGAVTGLRSAARVTEQLLADLSAEPILDTLRRHAVDFVVIGGLAGMAHGSTYPTFDLDIASSLNRSNLERLAAALRESGRACARPATRRTSHSSSMLAAWRTARTSPSELDFGNFHVLARSRWDSRL